VGEGRLNWVVGIGGIPPVFVILDNSVVVTLDCLAHAINQALEWWNKEVENREESDTSNQYRPGEEQIKPPRPPFSSLIAICDVPREDILNPLVADIHRAKRAAKQALAWCARCEQGPTHNGPVSERGSPPQHSFPSHIAISDVPTDGKGSKTEWQKRSRHSLALGLLAQRPQALAAQGGYDLFCHSTR